MNELINTENKKIENMIYEIRGQQVMLASDIALLYNSETKIINQVVKRNINQFPENFCFKLTSDEYLMIKNKINKTSLRSQIVTLNISNNLIEQKYINNMVLEHDNDIKLLKETFDNFKTKANHIFF